MRSIELLVKACREQTGNTEYTSETGLQDSIFIQAATEAQERIHSLVLKQMTRVFLRRKIVVVPPQSKSVPIPNDAYLDTRIEKVEFAQYGNEDRFQKLDQYDPIEMEDSRGSCPEGYTREGSEIYLYPPSGSLGKVRFTYQYKFPRLDKRRGRVLSATVDTDSKTITGLSLDTTASLDAEEMVEESFITIVDRNGKVKMQGIPVDAVNVNSGEVTLAPGFNYTEGESISVGDFVCLGAYSSTHSPLPDIAEKYLLRYMKTEAQGTDSSSDSAQNAIVLEKMEVDIVESYSKPQNDVKTIPLISNEFTTFCD